MIEYFQENFVYFFRYINTLDRRIILFASLISIIYSCIIINSILAKKLHKKLLIEKILFAPALITSIIFGLYLFTSGGVYSDLSAETVARVFTRSLTDGVVERLKENDNKFLTPEYHPKFFEIWEGEYKKELSKLYSKKESFDLVKNYFEKPTNNYDKSLIVLRLTDYIDLQNTKNAKELKQVDYYFTIDLVKIPIPSNHLGNFMRWRINNFSYNKSEPYTLDEWFKRMGFNK